MICQCHQPSQLPSFWNGQKNTIINIFLLFVSHWLKDSLHTWSLVWTAKSLFKYYLSFVSRKLTNYRLIIESINFISLTSWFYKLWPIFVSPIQPASLTWRRISSEPRLGSVLYWAESGAATGGPEPIWWNRMRNPGHVTKFLCQPTWHHSRFILPSQRFHTPVVQLLWKWDFLVLPTIETNHRRQRKC